MQSLFEQVDVLIKRKDLPWTRRGDTITVRLAEGRRRHQVNLTRKNDGYVFRSIVLRAANFPPGVGINDLAYRAWRRNTISEVVAFGFDGDDSLVGTIEQPNAKIDHEELEVYIQTLAAECDQFEYDLSGSDVS